MEVGRLMYTPETEQSDHDAPALHLRRVVMVAGEPGAGKTELSGMIARHTGYPRLEKDLLSGRSDRAGTYRTLLDLAADITSNGSSVILDAGFLPELASPGWLTRQEDGFELLGARLDVILVRADRQTREERMRLRGMPRDTARLANARAVRDMDREPGCTVVNSAGFHELLEQSLTVVAGLGLTRDI